MFGSSRARPQDPELAVWSSGTGVPTGPGVLAFGARDMGFGSRRAPQPPGLAVRFGGSGHRRHSKGGDEEEKEEEEELYPC